jgi:membrane protease YdiL (CAAX protease family)
VFDLFKNARNELIYWFINLKHNKGGILSQQNTGRIILLKRAGWFLVFFICESAVFIFGSNYFDVFPTNHHLTYNLATCAVFLVSALVLKRSERWNRYWLVAFAFFVASLAFPSTLLTIDWINNLMVRFSLTPDTTSGIAVGKVVEVILVVVPILVLTRLSGSDMGSVFLRRGNLKLGLGVGTLVFFFLVPASFMFAAQRFTSVDTLVSAVLWGLVFSFANSLMEELWIRGIFLKRFKPLIGSHRSIWLTAMIFALMHGFAFYFEPAALVFYVLNTLALGLACGYLMMKTDSIWGAVLIHAASDFFLFIAVLAKA